MKESYVEPLLLRNKKTQLFNHTKLGRTKMKDIETFVNGNVLRNLSEFIANYEKDHPDDFAEKFCRYETAETCAREAGWAPFEERIAYVNIHPSLPNEYRFHTDNNLLPTLTRKTLKIGMVPEALNTEEIKIYRDIGNWEFFLADKHAYLFYCNDCDPTYVNIYSNVISKGEITEWEELCESEDLEPNPIEILQYFLVTDHIGEKLTELGEIVEEVHGLPVWGRSCCGQAISMDEVIKQIYQNLFLSTS